MVILMNDIGLAAIIFFFYTLFTYNFLLVSRKLNEWEPKNVFNKTHVFFKFLESW